MKIGVLIVSGIVVGLAACSSSATQTDTSSDGGAGPTTSSKKAGFGEDCMTAEDCAEPETKCIKAGRVGFCTHSCTKTEDCPSDGWACNLSPYTACVPK